MTKEFFCTLEQSNRLKRLGFDIPCWCAYYNTGLGMQPLRRSGRAENHNAGFHVSSPTQEVANAWLRDTVQLTIVINPQMKSTGQTGFGFSVFQLDGIIQIGRSYDIYDKHELAMSAALDYTIEYILIQNKWKKLNI